MTELSFPIPDTPEANIGADVPPASAARAGSHGYAASEQHIRSGRRPVAVAGSNPSSSTAGDATSVTHRISSTSYLSALFGGTLPRGARTPASPKPSEPGTAMSLLPPARMVRIPSSKPSHTPGGRMPS